MAPLRLSTVPYSEFVQRQESKKLARLKRSLVRASSSSYSNAAPSSVLRPADHGDHYQNPVASPRPVNLATNIVIRQVADPGDFGRVRRKRSHKTENPAPLPPTLEVQDYHPISPATSCQTDGSEKQRRRARSATLLRSTALQRNAKTSPQYSGTHSSQHSTTFSKTHSNLNKSLLRSMLRRNKARSAFTRAVRRLRAKFRSFRRLLHRRRKHAILNEDDELLAKYQEKKLARMKRSMSRLQPARSARSCASSDKLAVFPLRTLNTGEQNARPPKLTAQNLQKLQLQPFEPIKKDLLENYISQASEEVSQRDGLQLAETLAGPAEAVRSSIKATSVELDYEGFVTGWSAYLKNAIAQRTALKLEVSRDLEQSESIGAYTSTDGTSVAHTPAKRMSVLEAILGEYEADDETRTIVGSEKSLDSTSIGREQLEINEIVLEETQKAPCTLEPIAESQNIPHTLEPVAETMETEREDTAGNDHGLDELHEPIMATSTQKAEEVVPDTSLISSQSTLDSADSIRTGDTNTQFYSIGEPEDKLGRSETVVVKHELHEDKGRLLANTRLILDMLAIPETSISDLELNLTMDLFAEPRFENLRAQHHSQRLTASNKAALEVLRAALDALRVAPLNLGGPKKYRSMGDMNRLRMENNLRSLSAMAQTSSLADRPLSMRYNRKTNNTAIIRFLLQQRAAMA